jgi:hypothetical protein
MRDHREQKLSGSPPLILASVVVVAIAEVMALVAVLMRKRPASKA